MSCRDWIIWLILFPALVLPAQANELHFKATARGLADIKVTLDDASITGAQKSDHILVLLPIRIGPNAHFEKPDNTEIGVLALGATHTLLSVLFSPIGQKLEFNVVNALDVYGTLERGRARFSADMSYSNFVTHQSLLGSKGTISSFGLKFELPKEYGLGELGFKPSSGEWTKSGVVWAINSSNASSSGEVFLEFPDPFEMDTDFVRITLSAFLAIVVAIIAPVGIGKFRDNRFALGVCLLVAGAGTILFARFLWTTPDPMASLVWGVTPFISLTVISGASIFYLFTSFFVVRVVGAVAIKNDIQRQLFLTRLSVFEITDKGQTLLKSKEQKVGGNFDFFVTIGRVSKKIKVLAEVETFKPAYSGEKQAEVGKPVSMDTILIEQE